jgi:hypothetical protein
VGAVREVVGLRGRTPVPLGDQRGEQPVVTLDKQACRIPNTPVIEASASDEAKRHLDLLVALTRCEEYGDVIEYALGVRGTQERGAFVPGASGTGSFDRGGGTGAFE